MLTPINLPVYQFFFQLLLHAAMELVRLNFGKTVPLWTACLAASCLLVFPALRVSLPVAPLGSDSDDLDTTANLNHVDWSKFFALDFEALVKMKQREYQLLTLTTQILRFYFVFVVLGLVPGVLCSNVGLTYMNSNTAAAISLSLTFSNAFAMAVNDAIGTTPEKNFKKFTAAVNAKGVDSRVVFMTFSMCIYSANPAVWTKIMNNTAPGSVPADVQTVWTALKTIMPGGANAILVYTRAQAMQPNQIRTTGILASDPSVACWAWVCMLPTSMNTYSNLIGRRFTPAMAVTKEVLDDCENTQKKFMKEVMKKTTWEQKFFDTASRSAYIFPRVDPANPGLITTFSHNGSNTLARDSLQLWINTTCGTSAGTPAAVPAYTF